jgi:primosomal protein N' (replication factor Y)
MFAEIALPVNVSQTFTYRLPTHMVAAAKPGSRVIVPFGKKLQTAFIVGIHEDIDDELRAAIKDVQELIDETPVVNGDILELTRWMADYYYAPWGECLRSALPAGTLAATEKLITITDAGRTAVATLDPGASLTTEDLGASRRATKGFGARRHTTKDAALELLAKSGTMSSRELEQQSSRIGTKPAAIAALVRRLERDGYVRITQRVGESRLRPRLQNVVRLIGTRDSGRASRPGNGGPIQDRLIADPGPADSGTSDELRLPALPKADMEAADEPSLTGKRRTRGARQKDGEKRLTEQRLTEQRLTEQQQRVIDQLAYKQGPVPLSELLEAAGTSVSAVRTLEKRGIVEVFAREVRRDPLEHLESAAEPKPVQLTPDQQTALDVIVQKMGERQYSTFLLHGVTGSGKTEIYIRAMAEALRQGRTALMLIPEISLTPVFSRRLRSHFGSQLAILHSSLSEGERVDEWRRIKDGDARIVIGTRSAVFAPLQDLGLVVVDEEHDSSYKQDESPRYSGRDTAIMRASDAGAVVVLGSATPSLESFHNAHTGKYTYLRLESRYGSRGLAKVEAVDMREVFRRHGKQQIFSDELKEAIGAAHSRREQVMILLNRRGFSSFLICRSCGIAIKCQNCDVTLTFHKYNLSLQCHYCNYIRPVPKNCPACDGKYVHYVGEGTEQIEAMLRDMFPAMHLGRLDRDTTRRRGSFEHILMEFAAGAIDLLVGTQMIAKGHDFHNVTLVGVISVDAGLAMPDFRSAERTFQLLTQVAGRAGRGDRPGKVIIQTYHPEHYAVVCARAQDYEGFYQREINFRRMMNYPPFCALVNILVHDKEVTKAHGTADRLASELRQAAQDQGMIRVLGPAPAPLARLRNEYRFQVLIKARNRRSAREALDIAMDRALKNGINPYSISIEVDPINLM